MERKSKWYQSPEGRLAGIGRLAAFGLIAWSCFASRTVVVSSLEGSNVAQWAEVLSLLAVLLTLAGCVIALTFKHHESVVMMTLALLVTGCFNAGFWYQVLFGSGGDRVLAEGQVASIEKLIVSLESQRETLESQRIAELAKGGVGPNSRAIFTSLQETDAELADYRTRLMEAELLITQAEASVSPVVMFVDATFKPDLRVWVIGGFILLLCVILDPFAYALLVIAQRVDNSKPAAKPRKRTKKALVEDIMQLIDDQAL